MICDGRPRYQPLPETNLTPGFPALYIEVSTVRFPSHLLTEFDFNTDDLVDLSLRAAAIRRAVDSSFPLAASRLV